MEDLETITGSVSREEEGDKNAHVSREEEGDGISQAGKQGSAPTRESSPTEMVTIPREDLETLMDSLIRNKKLETLVESLVERKMEEIMPLEVEASRTKTPQLVPLDTTPTLSTGTSTPWNPGSTRKQEESRKIDATGNMSVCESEIDIDDLIQAKKEGRQIQWTTRVDEQELLVGDKLRKETVQEEAGGEWHTPFGESTYTLLYMCEFQSQGFWYGVFVYLLQMTTIALTLVDIIDPGSSNPLRLPAMVDLTVTVSQFVALFLALAYQSDLIEAVLKIQEGFYPEILEQHIGATYPTWLFSCVAQLLSGLLLTSTIFVLTMQVADVLSIMLNFAALHFMAEIDDLGFSIAGMGFLTDKLQRVVEDVSDVQVPKPKRMNIYRRILYFLTLTGLFVGYGILKQRQLDGLYLPTYLYVQFGDAYNPKIPYYSGLLTSGDIRTAGHREYRDVDTEDILLSYCKEEKAWTFSDQDDPCNYFAKSYQTRTYDVTTIPDSGWEIVDPINRLQPFDTFSLVGRDCKSETCKGNCSEGLCRCPNNRFGVDCEFADVCPQLVLDLRTSVFPNINYQSTFDGGSGGLDIFAASDDFHILKNLTTGQYIKVYNMPVYYSFKIFPASVMFFGGRRWVITSERDFLNFTDAKLDDPSRNFFPNKTIGRFENEFHGYHQATFRPFFFSDPVDYETPDFLPTPAGLTWWTVGIVNEMTRHYAPDSQVDTLLNCKSCLAHEEGFCGVGGICNHTKGVCDCSDGYLGDKCEVEASCYNMAWPCWGEGECDTFSGSCSCRWPGDGKVCGVIFQCFEEDGMCLNGGNCDMDSGQCDCPNDPAITGWSCEKVADCHVAGCSNGGVCALNGRCICRPPFHGILCDLVNSTQGELICAEDADCSNGICNATTGVCACANPNSFGTLCEHQYNCTWGGCANSGICNEDTGLCECLEPYIGPDCIKEPACSEDAYCENHYGEWSVCDLGTRTCRCGWFGWFLGKRCEINCKFDGCENGGFCNVDGYCECPNPYSGNYCEYIAEDVSSLTSTVNEKIEACVAEYGFPPYAENDTDCRRIK